MHTIIRFVLVAILLPASIALPQAAATTNLLEARKAHQTSLAREVTDESTLDSPPADLFEIVEYPTPLGPMKAYLGRPPASHTEGAKHPAIIWLTGGFPVGGGGSYIWETPDKSDDQSAQSYRHTGLVMMYPALRGSYANPGRQESFYGEVNDVISALELLKQVPYVDPDRIYLGGHSTGGTLALLVAEATDAFVGVFAFGAIDDPTRYGGDSLTYDPTDRHEAKLRAPIHYLDMIRSPTWAIEGTQGSLYALKQMDSRADNTAFQTIAVQNATHFDLLYPINSLIAKQIIAAEGKPLAVDAKAIQAAFDSARKTSREANDLLILARVRAAGVDLKIPQTATYYFWDWELKPLQQASTSAKALGFATNPVQSEQTRDGDTYYILMCQRLITLSDLDAVFNTSLEIYGVADQCDVNVLDWEVLASPN